MIQHKCNHESRPDWEPLEDHLKHLAPPDLPPSWKVDILNLARQQENAANHQLRVSKHAGIGWLMKIADLIQNAFARPTPAQISMAVIWSLVCVGNKVDYWLNAPVESHVPCYLNLGLTESFSTQIKSWELSGLHLTPSEKDGKKTLPESPQNQPDLPAPRSKLKTDHLPHGEVTVEYPLHIVLVEYMFTIPIIPAETSLNDAPLPSIPLVKGPGSLSNLPLTLKHPCYET